MVVEVGVERNGGALAEEVSPMIGMCGGIGREWWLGGSGADNALRGELVGFHAVEV